ncbi:HNH endonuclease signature motif containing protein, partial [Jiangella asiatica]|uniref:HNH endonuclease signature motif containing protein n=1 Tax=Jiangella asiatica TaxID=2530372 RepID=UPI0013A5E09A
DATLRRLVTDPVDGRLLDYGHTTYQPPQALVDFIIARDRTCRFPTSDTPAPACDLDHRVPYHDGGTTSEHNLQPLARRFHLDKTLHGWRLDSPEPGVLVWTSPAGRTYRV